MCANQTNVCCHEAMGSNSRFWPLSVSVCVIRHYLTSDVHLHAVKRHVCLCAQERIELHFNTKGEMSIRLIDGHIFFFPCHRILRSKQKDKNGQTSGIEMNLGYLPIVIRISNKSERKKEKKIYQ